MRSIQLKPFIAASFGIAATALAGWSVVEFQDTADAATAEAGHQRFCDWEACATYRQEGGKWVQVTGYDY